MKELVLRKLSLTERGALNILEDKELCNRIISEDIIKLKDAVSKYNVPEQYIYNLMKGKKISYISNAGFKRGCKKYLFVSEIEELVNSGFRYSKTLSHVGMRLYNVVDRIAKKILSDREYSVFANYNNNMSMSELAVRYNITRQNIHNIYNKCIYKIKNYSNKYIEYDDLVETNKRIKRENIALEKANKALQEKIESEVVSDINAYSEEGLIKLNMSLKVKRLFRNLNIKTPDDLMEFIFKNGIEYFLKCRNIGVKTFNSIEEIVEKIKKDYGYCEFD